MRIYYSLYDRLLHRVALAVAFAKVRRAKGAPGVDGQTIAEFETNLGAELNRLVDELRTSDDYLLAASENADLFEISYVSKKPLITKWLSSAAQVLERRYQEAVLFKADI